MFFLVSFGFFEWRGFFCQLRLYGHFFLSGSDTPLYIPCKLLVPLDSNDPLGCGHLHAKVELMYNSQILLGRGSSFSLLLSDETHRQAATGITKSREVTGALAGTAPSSTARNSVTRPEISEKVGRAT